MKILLIISLSLWLIFPCFSQPISYEWGHSLQSNGNYSSQFSFLDTDFEGNTIVMGIHSGTTDFSSGLGTHVITSINPFDYFLAKYSPSGEVIWVQRIPFATFSGTANNITTDNAGNIYLAGSYDSPTNFTIGNGTSDTRTPKGLTDIFILKIDPNGNSVWSKSFGGEHNDTFQYLTLDKSNNIVLTGKADTEGILEEYDADATGFPVTTENGSVLIVKLNTDGITQLVKTFGSNTAELTGEYVTVDNNNNIYVLGIFQGYIFFQEALAYLNSVGSNDILVLKTDSEGNLLNATDYGGANNDLPRSISVDAGGSVYITGNFSGSIDLDPSSVTQMHGGFNEGTYIQKLNSDFELVWAKSFDSVRDLRLVMDNYDNLIVAGQQALNDFFVSGQYTQTSPGYGRDLFVGRLDRNGEFIWVVNTGSPTDAASVYNLGLSVDIDDNILVSGDFYLSMDLDPTTGVDFANTNVDGGGYLIKISDASAQTNDLALNSSMSFFPNPTEGNVNFNAEKNGTFQLFDSSMKLISQTHFENGLNSIQLPNSPGIYFIQLLSNQKTEFVRIIRK